MSTTLQDAERALLVTKIRFMEMDSIAFIANVLFSLRFSWTDKLPTAGTDGLNLVINPNFFLGLSPDERIFLMAHEAWHVCFSHVTRKPSNVNHKVWNMAADYVINVMLVDNGFTMIEGGLLDRQYVDMSTEQVYSELMKNPPPEDESTPGTGDDLQEPGSLGEPDPSGEGEGEPMDAEEVQAQIDEIVAKAVMGAKMQEGEAAVGNLPGEVGRYVDDLINPKVPWNVLLQNYMSAFDKTDYSMRRPNRRFISAGMYLPSLFGESMGQIAMFCDASGSVGEEEFNAFFHEVRYIKDVMQPSDTTIVSFDTQIQSELHFYKDDVLGNPVLEGGGGTQIGPVIKWLNKNSPEIAVVFSDGYFNFPKEQYKGDLLWLIYDNPTFTAPYGKVIHFHK